MVLSVFAIVPFSAGAAEIAENTDQTEASSYSDPKPSGDYEIGTTEAASEKIVEDELGADVADSSNDTVDPDAEVGDNNAAVKPASPTLSLSNTVNGLTASWKKVDNAESYKVYYQTFDAGKDWTFFDTTDTSCVIPDAVSGTLYRVKVQSIGADELEGGYSDIMYMTYIDRAEITSLSFNGSANTLAWNVTGGANKYQIAKKRIGDSSYTYYTTTATTYTDKNVVNANTYCYQVRAMYATEKNGTAYGAWSASKSVVTLAQTNVSLANKSNGIRAQWNAVGGAKRYAVYFKSAEDAAWSTASTTDTYYPILNVKSGTLYFVQVRPVAGNISGAYSNVKAMTFIGRPAVTLSNAMNGVNVGWNSVQGANRYQIAKKKNGASSYSYYTTENTSYQDKDVAGNTNYSYQVRAMYATENNGTAYGEWSATKSILRLTAPTVSLSNKSNGLRVDWSKTAGATKYTVYIKAATASSWQSATTTNTYYPMLTVKSGVLYYVQVRPHGNGVSGPFSKPKSMTYIGPANLKLSMSGSNLALGWNSVAGANKYQIAKLKKGNSAYEYIYTTGTSYIDKAVTGSKDFYSYQVRAMYETANSGTAYGAWSSVWYFSNGKIISDGYHIINGYRYYYKNGVVQKNGIVGTKSEGYYYADANGVCCVSEEMRLAAEFVMNYGSGSTAAERMKTSFKSLATRFPYRRSYDHPKSKTALPGLAIDMFKNKRGNCFRYAACFTCIAKVCGYRARMVVGSTGNGSPHGWSEVYMDGKWYYFDPDMQLPSYGFPDYYAYKMSSHPWNVKASFRSEVTINNGKAVWN